MLLETSRSQILTDAIVDYLMLFIEIAVNT